MTRDAGYTIVELLVATAVMLVAVAGFVGLVDSSAARAALWNESADLHQRARAAADVLTSVAGAAGAGTARGPLHHLFAAVEPRRRPGPVTARALTVRSMPSGAALGTLDQPLAPGADVIVLAPAAACPDGHAACGFAAGMDVVLFDGAGQWDTAVVRAIGPGSLLIADRAATRTFTYPAGSHVAQLDEATIYLDDAEGTLRREHPGLSSAPLIDNVVDFRVEYIGDPAPPLYPRPAPGAANCLYASDGSLVPHPTLGADHGSLASLPLGMFSDGPLCGSGATAYDVDLLRVRKVRLTLRLQTGPAFLRGTDPALFARPGAARAADRQLPDVQFTLVITPPSLRR